MLREKGHNWWNFSAKGLELSLGIRVVDVEVANTQEGGQILQEWSARPIDLLILGPGIPQLGFSKVTLPKSTQRKVVFLGATSDLANSVLVDSLELRKFTQSYCKSFCQDGCSLKGKELAELFSLNNAQAKCQIIVAPLLEENPPLNGGLKLELNWNSIVSRLLNASMELSEKSSLAKISNAEIKVLPDPLASKDFKIRFDLFLKNFSLENLQ